MHYYVGKFDQSRFMLVTQTPQFPAQHVTRNYVEWEKLRADWQTLR